MRVLKIPSNASLLLTNLCNLRCLHCFADSSPRATSDELTEAQWIGVISRLRKLGVFAIDVSGGEVFVRPDALQILECIMAEGFAKVSLSSNATLINRSIADCLAAMRLTSMMVSIDGGAEVHDALRVTAGAYRRAMTGIANLAAAGIVPVVRFTVTRGNVDCILPTARTLSENGIRHLDIANLAHGGRCIENFGRIGLRPEDRCGLGERIEEARQRFPKLYISYSGNLAESLPADPAGRQSKPASLLSCSAGNTACAIDACGWVLPCTMMPHLRVGNVLQEDFADIWHHSPVLEQIRALRSVTIDQVPFCRDCRYVSVCNGGCRGTAYNKFRDLLAPDPDCPFADAYAASASSGGSLVQLGGAQTKTAVPEFAPAPAGVAAAPPRIGRRCTDDFGRSGPAVAIPNRGSATAVSHKAEVSWLEAGRGRSNFQRQGL